MPSTFKGACPQVQDSNRGGLAGGHRAPVIVPDDFQSVLDTCGGSFRAALTNYRDKLVAPEDRENFAKLFDFGLVRSTVFSSNLLEHRYRKTDGRSFCIRVTPYSRSGSHINEVLWIFADEEVE